MVKELKEKEGVGIKPKQYETQADRLRGRKKHKILVFVYSFICFEIYDS